MTAREIKVPAGTRRVIEFATTYSADWSVSAKRNTDILTADVTGARLLLKRNLSNADEDADVTKTLADGISVSSGKVTATLDAGDTAELQGKYFATLRLYLADDGVIDWKDDHYDAPYIVLTFTQGAVEATV